jgi:hypothetical protein
MLNRFIIIPLIEFHYIFNKPKSSHEYLELPETKYSSLPQQ